MSGEDLCVTLINMALQVDAKEDSATIQTISRVGA
jgi:hypothetical protein